MEYETLRGCDKTLEKKNNMTIVWKIFYFVFNCFEWNIKIEYLPWTRRDIVVLTLPAVFVAVQVYRPSSELNTE